VNTINPALQDPSIGGPGRAGAPGAPARPGAPVAPSGPAFAEHLQRATSDVRFSGHALQRVERRGIDASETTLARLSDGISRAAAKGSRESVVLVDDAAFVVSVPNRTVITAVGREHMREQVFTNIDSAVIA
jgi:flagellar operon protein